MISKETFCRALSMLVEQMAIYEEFSNALEKVGDGHFVFGADDKCNMALRMVLKECMNDKYDYIDWWLWDGAPNYIVRCEAEKKEWILDTPEALYDYIVQEAS